MTTLICGSIALDTILSSPFPFALEPEAVAAQRVSVSYFMPDMAVQWGGCGANIAYAMQQLGGKPLLMGTVGRDAQEYIQRFNALGIDTQYIKVIPEAHTARAVIMSDNMGQQITGFHPGAMDFAHELSAKPIHAKHTIDWAIISPDGKEGMLSRAQELGQLGVKTICDPGQAMPILSREDLQILMQHAKVLAVNEHEAEMLQKTLGQRLAQIAERISLLVTLGDQGLMFYENAETIIKIPAVQNIATVDATGCGDALRGAWLFGLSQGASHIDSLRLGTLLAAHKLQYKGGQGYTADLSAMRGAWETHFIGLACPF